MQIPTGAGKTRIAAELCKDKRSIFVVPRLSLIEQTCRAFEAEGISAPGVIQGKHCRTDVWAPVQIASAQTLARRAIPHASLVIIDECHLQFDSIRKWISDESWGNVPFIGLTATPWARGMGSDWQTLLRPTSIVELIDSGYLSKFRVLAPPPPDLEGVRITAGDFNEKDLSAACNRMEIVGNVIETWLKQAEGRSTLCYGVDRAHAKHLQERFIESGIATEYVDCDTPLFEREEIFQRFQSSETKVICNVATLDTGIDLDVRCIVDARPTRSRIRFVQTIGRGLRTAEGKDHCLILDHAGNHRRLGLVTEIGCNFLDDGAARRGAEREPVGQAFDPKLCPECHCVQAPHARECPQCGHAFPAVTLVREREGDLVELGSKVSGLHKPSAPDERFWFGALCHMRNEAARRGKYYKQSWVAAQFKEKFGHWPPREWDTRPFEPTVEVRNWVRSRQIAYAKSRARYG